MKLGLIPEGKLIKKLGRGGEKIGESPLKVDHFCSGLIIYPRKNGRLRERAVRDVRDIDGDGDRIGECEERAGTHGKTHATKSIYESGRAEAILEPRKRLLLAQCKGSVSSVIATKDTIFSFNNAYLKYVYFNL